MLQTIRVFILLVGVLFSLNCFQRGECQTYAQEIYSEDTSFDRYQKETSKIYAEILQDMGESSVEDAPKEAYLFTFITAFHSGQSIRIEEDTVGYRIRVTCFNTFSPNRPLPDCEAYEASLPEKYWRQYLELIEEFNLWTEPRLRFDSLVTDGYTYLLEGRRPKAAPCGKRSYTLTARGSVYFDKIDALGERIFELEEWNRSAIRAVNES